MTPDVVVVGSGAAGLSAALRAAKAGLTVIVLEKADYFGGTTSLSGGGAWIPCNPRAIEAGVQDSLDTAKRYVLGIVGEAANQKMIDAYLNTGPEMIAWMAANSEVDFVLMPGGFDWFPDVPGAAEFGRAMVPEIYDGTKLGAYFKMLRPARDEFNAPGGMMFDLHDLPYLSTLPSPRSLAYMGKLGARFAWDKLRGYTRGTRLTMGNALAARLLRSVLDAGVELRRNAAVQSLLIEEGRIAGVRLSGGEDIRARLGVVLASGGFSANAQLRKAYIPYAEHHISVMTYENTGDGMNMALDAGAKMGDDNLANAAWSVVSTATLQNGYVARYLHLVDMAKPGCIAVNDKGERFGNEASLHFVSAMHDAGAVPAHIIADAAFVKTYGMGMVFPRGGRLKQLLDVGYITAAPTLRALALKIGVDAEGLERAVAQANHDAQTGVDETFGKGSTPTDRAFGDPKHTPNPCLGPIVQAPFYAIKIHPGDAATTVGLRIDTQARVLNGAGEPIPGLYAAGLDAHSIWRGRLPGAGCNIGPGLVFGYIAGKSLEAAARAA